MSRDFKRLAVFVLACAAAILIVVSVMVWFGVDECHENGGHVFVFAGQTYCLDEHNNTVIYIKPGTY